MQWSIHWLRLQAFAVLLGNHPVVFPPADITECHSGYNSQHTNSNPNADTSLCATREARFLSSFAPRNRRIFSRRICRRREHHPVFRLSDYKICTRIRIDTHIVRSNTLYIARTDAWTRSLSHEEFILLPIHPYESSLQESLSKNVISGAVTRVERSARKVRPRGCNDGSFECEVEEREGYFDSQVAGTGSLEDEGEISWRLDNSLVDRIILIPHV